MKELNFKSYKNFLRLGFFQVVLFFSVFALSGGQVNIQSIFQQGVKTELVETRVCKPIYKLKHFTKIYSQPYVQHLSTVKPFSSWALSNLNQLIATTFKVHRKKMLLFSIVSIPVIFKIPSSSSTDDLSPLTR